MRYFHRITICSAFILALATLGSAQTAKTAQGFFCGFSEGDGGYVSVRVGNAEKTFAIYGDELPVKYIGFKNDRQRGFDESILGTEMIISYVFKKPVAGGGRTNIIRSVRLTGKVNKATRSCGFGL